uniref:Uncharacterized protein n=1 Tax=Rangifer tarandus platyrhynchus TaxID=3082113 RepID=A0ACB0FJS2_RANTA|nr:unnamed protein product [Rangifer tarandus platyrhynchus]
MDAGCRAACAPAPRAGPEFKAAAGVWPPPRLERRRAPGLPARSCGLRARAAPELPAPDEGASPRAARRLSAALAASPPVCDVGDNAPGGAPSPAAPLLPEFPGARTCGPPEVSLPGGLESAPRPEHLASAAGKTFPSRGARRTGLGPSRIAPLVTHGAGGGPETPGTWPPAASRHPSPPSRGENRERGPLRQSRVETQTPLTPGPTRQGPGPEAFGSPAAAEARAGCWRDSRGGRWGDDAGLRYGFSRSSAPRDPDHPGPRASGRLTWSCARSPGPRARGSPAALYPEPRAAAERRAHGHWCGERSPSRLRLPARRPHPPGSGPAAAAQPQRRGPLPRSARSVCFPCPTDAGGPSPEPPLGAGDLRPQASPLPRPSSVPSVVSDPSTPGEPGLLPNKVAIYKLLGR